MVLLLWTFKHGAQVDLLEVLNVSASETEEFIYVLARLLFGGHWYLLTYGGSKRHTGFTSHQQIN
ncbi:MAG: hypothetical protein ABSE41_02125 [Bacteroidota bacterium]